jgi:hypothetical protein
VSVKDGIDTILDGLFDLAVDALNEAFEVVNNTVDELFADNVSEPENEPEQASRASETPAAEQPSEGEKIDQLISAYRVRNLGYMADLWAARKSRVAYSIDSLNDEWNRWVKTGGIEDKIAAIVDAMNTNGYHRTAKAYAKSMHEQDYKPEDIDRMYDVWVPRA